MKKVLFIASHRKDRAPAQRFRYEQFLDYLESNGFQCELSSFISDEDDRYLYLKGKYLRKLLILAKSVAIRFKDLARADEFDIIFIQREALLLGSSFFEKRFSKSKAKVMYDFDDSLWLGDTSDANKKLKWLKHPGKIAKIISIADMVFAGNKYLANYASNYNSNVKIIPTTLDTDWHKRTIYQKVDDGSSICIGWTGSITTIKHFQTAVPVLKKLKEKYGERLTFKVIGDSNYTNSELNIKGVAWNRENEINELSTLDIGIMPLPDDEWAKGKCGLKGLQYMALEIPPVMSPVGVNTEIIQDGVNGFLALTDEEWIHKLSLLIENRMLREQMGKAARKTVIEHYSKEAQKSNYLKYFNQVLGI